MERYTAFPERFREWRDSQGLSQAEAAERIGVERLTVTRWEAGKNFPRPEQLRAIADLSGRPLYWFFQEESEVRAGRANMEPEVDAYAVASTVSVIDEATSSALARVVGLAVGQAMSESQALLVQVLERIEHLERLRREEHAEVHRLRHEIRTAGKVTDAKYYTSRSDEAPSADARAEGA